MGLVYYTHYINDADPELGYFSSDITFDSESRNYYNVSHDGVKIGYKSETVIPFDHFLVIRDDAALKLDIAGKSREVFTQTSVTVDTLAHRTTAFDFILHSGAHMYSCSGVIQSDSLIIQVKKSTFDPVRTGVFLVEPGVTVPLALPYFLARAHADSMTIQVFDPVSFTIDQYIVSTRSGETIAIGDSSWKADRFAIMNNDVLSSIWLDQTGAMLKNSGSIFFSGEAGSATVERAFDRSVFLLPLETGIGDAMLDSIRLVPNRKIDNPRNVTYLDVRLDGIRAANIDIDAPDKEVTSLNPVTFIIRREDITNEMPAITDLSSVLADTTVLATTDYIEPHDARIRRLAEEITASETDSLAIAYAINRWVNENMSEVGDLYIIRSVDILKERRGAADEYTKLFTAMARSRGIPVYVNMGLVYKDGAFKYHSWPSVFAGGIWHNLDPYYGQERADATHISLIRGGFEQKIELFRLIRHITISIREYRHS